MKKISLLIIGMILVLVLVMTACGQAETPAATTTKPAATTAVAATTNAATTTTAAAATPANWWDSLGTPKYGGTIHLVVQHDPFAFDPYVAQVPIVYVEEALGKTDWTVDRNIWSFKGGYVPDDYKVGLLAESWDAPDLRTCIIHLRKGVYWENKPPVNGREFDAYDVEYSYNRVCGLKGFAKPIGGVTSSLNFIESVTATDKYTVVFKYNRDTGSPKAMLTGGQPHNVFVPREVVEAYGDMNDWKNVVGTGPFILSDFVSNSYYTLSRNPNYWGYDERYPQNKVPYADEVKIHIIADESTRIAALRSGQIDMIEVVSAEQAKLLAKTNPELQQIELNQRGRNIDFRCDVAPFNDIRVRKALQMAIDLEAMSKAYYLDDPTPYGLMGPMLTGFYIPYAEWPKELQAEYTYNPEGAKQLLAEAGFPNGFKTHVHCPNTTDIDMLKITQSYFKAIGVEMEIITMDANAYEAFLAAKKHDALTVGNSWSAGLETPPEVAIKRRVGGQGTNFTENNDPVYDAMYTKYLATTDLEEQKKIAREADMYAIEQHWHVVTVPQLVNYTVFSPKLYGYQGELHPDTQLVARWWKD